MAKLPTIKLGYSKWRDEETWIVISVTNSIEYSPGEALKKPEVTDLCTRGEWHVTIVGPTK